MTEKPKSYFGRIIAINLAIVVLLHTGRQFLAPSQSVFPLLFGLVFFNFMFMIYFSSNDQGDNAFACLLAVFVIGLIGFSDCATHSLGG